MSLDGTTGPPASDAERSGENTADTATVARTSALLDAVHSVVQQEVRAALAQPVGSERVPANSSADSDLGSLGSHPPVAAGLLCLLDSQHQVKAVRGYQSDRNAGLRGPVRSDGPLSV